MTDVPDWRKMDTKWVRQKKGDFKTEWYFSKHADLMVWRRRVTGEIEKFELTWEPPGPPTDRYYLFWDGHWACGRVDSGEQPWGVKMAPVVQEDHTLLENLCKEAMDILTDLAPDLPAEVMGFITERLRGH